MTIQEFHCLRLIHKVTHHTERTFYYSPDDKALHLYDDDTLSSCEKISGEIEGILDSLAKTQYVLHLPDRGMDDHLYRLTLKGLHYVQTSTVYFFSFLAKSVIVPIVVAFITALLVSLYAQ